MKKQNIETICIQGGYEPKNGQPRQLPIIQSTTYRYDTSADMGKLFDLESDGYMYSRLANPTCDMVAKKIAAMEGGSAAMLTSSGQAANFYAIFNIASCGDHIVASSTIYGGTFNLFSVTMKRMGIDFTFVNPDCTEEELDSAFSRSIAIGVLISVLSVLPMFVAGFIFDPEDGFHFVVSAGILLVMISIAANIFVRAGIKWESYQKLLEEGDYTRAQKDKVLEAISSVYWLSVTAIYLIYSFISFNWHISWVIWPVAGVIFAIINVVYSAVKRD